VFWIPSGHDGISSFVTCLWCHVTQPSAVEGDLQKMCIHRNPEPWESWDVNCNDLSCLEGRLNEEVLAGRSK
jgi:hypothetical protein